MASELSAEELLEGPGDVPLKSSNLKDVDLERGANPVPEPPWPCPWSHAPCFKTSFQYFLLPNSSSGGQPGPASTYSELAQTSRPLDGANSSSPAAGPDGSPSDPKPSALESTADQNSQQLADSPENERKSPEFQQATTAGTVGNLKGHIFRRIWHVTLFALVPLLFYCLDDFADAISLTPTKFISLFTLATICAEFLRLKAGIVVFGMREYERYTISAQFWGMFGIELIMLAAPYRPGADEFHDKAWIGLPIIWSLGIVDPLIGELKHRDWGLAGRSLVGIVAALIIFIVAWAIVETPWWFCLIYPPMVVMAEYAGGIFRIDDNGLMLIVPLLMTYVFLPWL